MPTGKFPLQLVETFVDRLNAIDTAADLRNLMEGITGALGYRHYALVHHDDLRKMRPGLVAFHNYPGAWADQFIERRLYVADPVVHACLRTNHAFAWSELANLIRVNASHRAILEAAAREGLTEGVSMPWSRPGMRCGSCSFGGLRRGCTPARCPLAIQLIGSFAFSAAVRIAGADPIEIQRKSRLMPRQRECIILVSHGKSDWDIARILGISKRTVRHYLDEARAAYDVVTRSQLVVAALLDGEVHLTEIAAGQPGF